MIVELIGPPGAGKTTLLPTVIEIFREMDMRAFTVVDAARPFARRTLLGRVVQRLPLSRWRPKVLWQIFSRLSLLNRLKFIRKHPNLIWQVKKSQSRRPLGSDVRKRKVLYWFFRLIGYYELLTAYIKPDEVVVFDEGFLHRVVQLFSSSVEEPSKNLIVGYIDLLPPPDIIVLIQASPEVCEKRIYKRGLWERLSHKNQDEISHFVVNAHMAINLAITHCRHKGWTIIEVNNDQNDLNIAQETLRRQFAKNLDESFSSV
jgi:thymidylate kinase